MENEHDDLRTRCKTSSSLSCCFINSHHHSDLLIESSPSPSILSSYSFHNKIKHDHNSPKIRGKCKSFIHRMGRHRRHVSADFSYDPLSYAMNFDDDDEPYQEFPPRNFATRLPLSPPSKDKIPITNMQSKSFKLPDQRSRAIQDVRRSLEMPIAQVKNVILTEDAKNTF
ncbi:hypothetical protein RDI58_019944 [Solanum bulbocastanum]|uniref:Uncharacterized protein n=1 Tax=Solanum bulbocastanum TaxID=147425 RepID=A0AAN8T5H1_SOLBU